MRLLTSKNSILFIPKVNTIECDVLKAWKLIIATQNCWTRFIKRKYNYLLKDRFYNNHSEFLKEKSVKIGESNRIVLFGYRDFQLPVIETVKNYKFIEPQWFDKNSKENITVLFVAGGANMLKHERWKNTFSNWISFEEKCDFLQGLPISEEVSKTMFLKFINAVYDHHNVENIKEAFEKIIEDSIHTLSSLSNIDADTFTTIHKLMINKANLRHHKD